LDLPAYSRASDVDAYGDQFLPVDGCHSGCVNAVDSSAVSLLRGRPTNLLEVIYLSAIVAPATIGGAFRSCAVGFCYGH